MRRTVLALAMFACAGGPAFAQGNFGEAVVLDPGARIYEQQQVPDLGNLNVFENRVYLACAIIAEKEIAITNTTGHVIAAGTLITYDYVRQGDGQHLGRRGNSPLMPPGYVLRDGIEPAVSCTAWYVAPLVFSP